MYTHYLLRVMVNEDCSAMKLRVQCRLHLHSRVQGADTFVPLALVAHH